MPAFPADVYNPKCPSRVVLNHVTNKWGVLVLIALRERTHRFSELRRKVGGVSEKMLAQTLGALEDDGFVQRTAYAEVPPRVEYKLTTLGREVAERVEGLVEWIEKNLARVVRARPPEVARSPRPTSTVDVGGFRELSRWPASPRVPSRWSRWPPRA